MRKKSTHLVKEQSKDSPQRFTENESESRRYQGNILWNFRSCQPRPPRNEMGNRADVFIRRECCLSLYSTGGYVRVSILIGYQYGGFSKSPNLPYLIVHVYLVMKEVLALQCWLQLCVQNTSEPSLVSNSIVNEWRTREEHRMWSPYDHSENEAVLFVVGRSNWGSMRWFSR